MERAEWLKQMRAKTESMYDNFSPLYWVSFGFYENETQLAFLEKFLERVPAGCLVLSAGCGAGRYDGYLLEAGHPVLGIDQSAGMLKVAREHFPKARYQKLGLQEMDFHEEFNGMICIDTFEHIPPEDFPVILHNFQAALKPGGMVYFNTDSEPAEDLETAFQKARAQGLPVVFGEVVHLIHSSTEQIQKLDNEQIPGQVADTAVYHYCPQLDQMHQWIEKAGLEIEEEGEGNGYYHFLASKSS